MPPLWVSLCSPPGGAGSCSLFLLTNDKILTRFCRGLKKPSLCLTTCWQRCEERSLRGCWAVCGQHPRAIREVSPQQSPFQA